MGSASRAEARGRSGQSVHQSGRFMPHGAAQPAWFAKLARMARQAATASPSEDSHCASRPVDQIQVSQISVTGCDFCRIRSAGSRPPPAAVLPRVRRPQICAETGRPVPLPGRRAQVMARSSPPMPPLRPGPSRHSGFIHPSFQVGPNAPARTPAPSGLPEARITGDLREIRSAGGDRMRRREKPVCSSFPPIRMTGDSSLDEPCPAFARSARRRRAPPDPGPMRAGAPELPAEPPRRRILASFGNRLRLTR